MTLATDITVIDVDSHVTEPPDLWTSRVSKKWGDLVPHVVFDESVQEERWIWAGQPGQPVTIGASAGWVKEFPSHPPTLEMADRGSWVASDRLQRMDEYGVHTQVIYPNIGGFGSARFLKLGEPELILECVKAYNDFATDFCSEDPKRLIPLMALPFWDLKETLKEVERCTETGHRGILFAGEPNNFGEPMIGDPHWDPLWSLAQECGHSINFHVGNSDVFFGFDTTPGNVNPMDPTAHGNNVDGVRTFICKFTSWSHMALGRHVSAVILGGVCHKFPRLNFVVVESGIGWMPFLMEELDWDYKAQAVHLEHPEWDLLPSEYFARQVYGCFWHEEGGLRSAVEQLGDNNFLYSTDYPHPVSMSPGPNAPQAVVPRDYIERVVGQLPESTQRKLLHDNAARIYHLD